MQRYAPLTRQTDAQTQRTRGNTCGIPASAWAKGVVVTAACLHLISCIHHLAPGCCKSDPVANHFYFEWIPIFPGRVRSDIYLAVTPHHTGAMTAREDRALACEAVRTDFSAIPRRFFIFPTLLSHHESTDLKLCRWYVAKVPSVTWRHRKERIQHTELGLAMDFADFSIKGESAGWKNNNQM
jgi:hypothetical protein